ncbi:MAG: zinc-ribbon domain-containing protein [Alphaproteobacteria bacterium]|nr:zinc-ribbon domain-containing protein [Alphaproteobacteria bacterium]
MILTCPSCEARFNVEPEALLPNGRTVRCGKCGHTWKEMPPEDMPKRVEEIEPPAPVVPEPDDIDSHPEYGNVGDDAIRSGDDHTGVPGIEDDFELPAHTPRMRSRRRQRRTRSLGPMVTWSAIVGIIAIIFGGGFFARDEIIDTWPPATMLYGMVGLAPEPGFGLELRTEASIQARDGDMEVLVIRGEVVNISSRPRIVPTLQGSLLDAGQNEIHSWTFSIVPEELAPGESGTFNTRVPNPPEGVQRVQVAFVEGKKGFRASTGRPTPDATSGKSSK